MHEEIKRSTKDGSSTKNNDKENLALASKARKGKGKASHSKSISSHGGKKIDKSKVRCFNFHEVGHYEKNCLLNKDETKTREKRRENTSTQMNVVNERERERVCCC